MLSLRCQSSFSGAPLHSLLGDVNVLRVFFSHKFMLVLYILDSNANVPSLNTRSDFWTDFSGELVVALIFMLSEATNTSFQ